MRGKRNFKLSVSTERPSIQKKVGCWRGAVRTLYSGNRTNDLL